MSIRREPGMTLCSTWTLTDYKGETISVGFVARGNPEVEDDGSEQFIGRAMNWRADPEGPTLPPDHLAQCILDGLSQPGVHRAIVDPAHWTLLKWIDAPPSFFDWRARESGRPVVNPADYVQMARMTVEYSHGSTSAVLRLLANDGGWTPVHMTINRIELEPDTFAALLALRLPTEAELAVVPFDDDGADGETKKLRKAKKRKKHKKKKHKPD